MRFLLLFILFFLAMGQVIADSRPPGGPVLIISSYNPETFQTSQNISTFLEEYKLLKGNAPVVIENMNCKSFSEAPFWKKRMQEILNKYVGPDSPRVLILLGQEAWAAYISQEDVTDRTVPVICGMVSRNAVYLPSDTTDLSEWDPRSLDVVRDGNIKMGGLMYEYDVEKNVRLILDFYPSTKHIAFISDNTYGGVCLQAHVKERMQNFPAIDLILLDGREHSIYTIVNKIGSLPPNTVILMGTWRVDKNEEYFMRNATYSMMSANYSMPAFSMTTVGLGHWALGGYIPEYRNIGRDLAEDVVTIESKGEAGIKYVSNQYQFDFQKLGELGFEKKELPSSSVMLNKELSFWVKYKFELTIIGLIFFFLLGGLVILSYFFVRTKKLKDQLEKSQGELLIAKEKAEESDRLKTAFLANMSHEIRTPLNAIVGFSNILIAEEFTPEEQKKFVDLIQINSDLLLRLINDILDISRLEAGKLNFTYEKCNLEELCREVLETTAGTKNEKVEYVFQPGNSHFQLVTDVQRLQQVLINLLSNANKFTEQGKITLDYSLDKVNQCVVFRVTDTGCGIDSSKLEIIFERFAKLNEYVQGTGLGLAICRITLNRLGGKIWVDPDYKEGACFVFTHPLTPPESVR